MNLGGNPNPTGGFNFGGVSGAAKPPATTATGIGTGGFSFGTATGQTATPVVGGFSLGATPSTTTTATATTAATGFSLTNPAASGVLRLGTAQTTGGFKLGGGTGATGTLPTLGVAATTPATTTASNPLLVGALNATTTAGTTPLGTGLGLSGTTASTSGSIFGTTAAKPQTTGLGGVDPKTSTTASGGTSTDPKSGDGKTLKQSNIPAEIVKTVDEFQKYVKDEKSVQESSSRVSSKPMYKVQEDVAALKQLVSVVSNGLQRNACAVEKLKKEMTQELKDAEMAQRTKDIPPGLQYENTAPTEYFQRLVSDFEHQMISYRQQIETLEGHLASLHQPNKLSPDELVGLLRKLHEAFIALAAQLHQVHESVKTQKEHYLNYRKIILHDTKNIFERERKSTPQLKLPTAHLGPSPFTDLSNAAAVAMATALTKSQQPASVPPVAGLTGTLGQPTGTFGATPRFGATTTTSGFGFGGFGSLTTMTAPSGFGSQLSTGFGGQTSTGFGGQTSTGFGGQTSTGFGGQTSTGFGGIGGFGATTTTTQSASFGTFGGTSGGTATVRPLGFGTAVTTATPSLFGSPSVGQATPTFGTATPVFGTATPVFGTATPQPNAAIGAPAPFQLNKPPGSKRGKR